jgi:hypothetical protein
LLAEQMAGAIARTFLSPAITLSPFCAIPIAGP